MKKTWMMLIAALLVSGCVPQTDMRQSDEEPWKIDETNESDAPGENISLPDEPKVPSNVEEDEICTMELENITDAHHYWADVSTMEFSPGGELLLTSSLYLHTANAFRVRDGELMNFPGSVGLSALTANWSRSVQTSYDLATVREMGEILTEFSSETGSIADTALSKNGELVGHIECPGDGMVVVTQNVDGSARRVVSIPDEHGGCSFWQQNPPEIAMTEKFAIVATPFTGRIHRVNLRTGELNSVKTDNTMDEHNTYTHGPFLYDMAVSPDGTKVATSGSEGFVKVWRIEDLTELVEWRRDSDRFGINSNTYLPRHVVSPVAWSPRGDALASINSDGDIEVGDEDSVQILETRVEDPPEYLEHHVPVALTFDASGERLGVGYTFGMGTWRCAGTPGSKPESLHVELHVVEPLQDGRMEVAVISNARHGSALAGYRVLADGKPVRFHGEELPVLRVHLDEQDVRELTVEVEDGTAAGSATLQVEAAVQ